MLEWLRVNMVPMVAALGTVWLGWLALRGLRSLELMKADMLTRATREAREGAVALCEEFAHEVIPANAPIWGALLAAKVEPMVERLEDIRFDPDDEGQVKAAQAWWKTVPPHLRGSCMSFVNRLESWAMHFTAELADEQLAAGPCAPAFCSMVRQYYALLLTMRATRTSGRFPNIVKVFNAWRERLEQEERGVRQADLLRELDDLRARGGGQNQLSPPLGTKLA